MAERTVLDYLRLLQSLLPWGKAWNRDDGSTLTEFLFGQAEEFARVDSRSSDLLIERDTRTATELLIDHELDLGIPDECSDLAATMQERRSFAHTKLISIGRQDKQYFIDVAASLGYTITITEFSIPFNLAPSGCCTDPDDDQDIVTGWVPSADTTITSEDNGITGNQLKVVSTGAGIGGAVNANMALTDGVSYRLRASAAADVGDWYYIIIYSPTYGQAYTTGAKSGAGIGVWDDYDVVFECPSTQTDWRIQLIAGGGGEIAYFDNVRLNLDIDPFKWQVNLSWGGDAWIFFRSGESVCGDPLIYAPGNDLLFCVLNRLKPAHTTIEIVSAGMEYGLGFDLGFPSAPSSALSYLQGAFWHGFDSGFDLALGGDFDFDAFNRESLVPNMAPTDCCTDPVNPQNNTTGWAVYSDAVISSVTVGTEYYLKVDADGVGTGRARSQYVTLVKDYQYTLHIAGGADVGINYLIQMFSFLGGGTNISPGWVAGRGFGKFDQYKVNFIVSITMTDWHIHVGATSGGNSYFNNAILTVTGKPFNTPS